MLTNVFKVALLPQKTHNLAVKIVKLYEDGELFPPSNSTQRRMKKISSSSFSFLKGLDPLEPKDHQIIHEMLTSWMNTKIRPSKEKGPPKQSMSSVIQKENRSELIKKWLGAQKEIKDVKDKNEKLKKEIVSLEKSLTKEKEESQKLKEDLDLLKRNLRSS